MKKKYLSLFICTLILISSVGFTSARATVTNSITGIWDLKDTSKIVSTVKIDRMFVFYPNKSCRLITELAKKRTSYTGTYTLDMDKLTLNYKSGTTVVSRTLTYALTDDKTLSFVTLNGTKKTYITYSKFVK